MVARSQHRCARVRQGARPIAIGAEQTWQRQKRARISNRRRRSERDALLALASIYLRFASPTPGGDPVAKFHLGNGARLQRINWAGDLSKNGLRQSGGMMVNYLYDLAKVEEYHERFLEGSVVHAQAVARLV